MRTVDCTIRLPANVTVATAGLLRVEVLDITLADAPSVTIAAYDRRAVPLQPGGQIACRFQAPETDPGWTITLRAHVSLDGSGKIHSGDLISTAAYPIPATGDVSGIIINLSVI